MPSLMNHPNGALRIERIEVRAAEEQAVAWRLGIITDATVAETEAGWDVLLGNMRLSVIHDATALVPRLGRLLLERKDGVRELDVGV